jgi:hypothetical protein
MTRIGLSLRALFSEAISSKPTDRFGRKRLAMTRGCFQKKRLLKNRHCERFSAKQSPRSQQIASAKKRLAMTSGFF